MNYVDGASLQFHKPHIKVHRLHEIHSSYRFYLNCFVISCCNITPRWLTHYQSDACWGSPHTVKNVTWPFLFTYCFAHYSHYFHSTLILFIIKKCVITDNTGENSFKIWLLSRVSRIVYSTTIDKVEQQQTESF